MTVAEIQEFIDEQIEKTYRTNGKIYYPFYEINSILEKIKSMLDELEPNTISQAIKVIDKERDKLKFDADKHQVDSCIFEIKNILGLGAKENNK